MLFSEEDLQDFKSEAIELLDRAEKSLLSINDGGDFKLGFDSIFRCFHNLKGSAGMMELNSLQSLMHELETAFMKFKDKASISQDFVTYFLKGIDGARSLLDGQNALGQTLECPVAEKGEMPVLDSTSDQFFVECDEIIGRISEHLTKIESKNYSKETIDGLYREFHSLKGAAYLFTFNHLGDIAHLVETSLEPVRDGAVLPLKPLIDAIYKSLNLIELEINSLKAGQSDPNSKNLLSGLAQELSKHSRGNVPEAQEPSSIQPTPSAVANQTERKRSRK